MNNLNKNSKLELHDLNRIKLLNNKKSRREKLNSAIYIKKHKITLKQIENSSYILSQPRNKINNNLSEESKVNFNKYNNSMIISEKEKDFLKRNLFIPKKINNPNEKIYTERDIISDQFQTIKKPKNKCLFLTYKENNNNNKKRISHKLININNFIYLINSFLKPNGTTFDNIKNLINYRLIYKESIKNIDFDKLLKRKVNKSEQITYELFFNYIIKRTFKELLKYGYLNNILINTEQVKNEYQRQIKDIKQYLKEYNDEQKDLMYNNLESLDKSNSTSVTSSLRESKINSNKIYKIITLEKQRKNGMINHNYSSDIIFHFHNFDKISHELKSQNMRYKYLELKRFRFLLSLAENYKFLEKNNLFRNAYIEKIKLELEELKKKENKNENKKENTNIESSTKNEIFKLNIIKQKQKKLSDIFKKQKKNNNKDNLNRKNNNTKNKGDIVFQTEISDINQLKGFNFFLDTHNKNNNNNEDIMNLFNNKDNMIKFSNLILNENIHKNNLNDSSQKEELVSQNNNETSEIINNTITLDNNIKENDLSFQAPSKYKSTSLKNSYSQNSMFNVDKKFFVDSNYNKKIIQLKNEPISKKYSELFYKEVPPIKDENRKETQSEKILKILLNKKVFVKRKKAVKERNFKDFIREENFDGIKKTTNSKQEEKKVVAEDEKKEKIIEKRKQEEKELVEKEFQNRFDNFKSYIQRLKNMSKDEFVNDTLKYTNNYQ